LILGLYHEDPKTNVAFGATIKSYDAGTTWKELALIGEKDGVYLDAETDVVALKNGTLLAALRSSKADMYFSVFAGSGQDVGTGALVRLPGAFPLFLAAHERRDPSRPPSFQLRRCIGRATKDGHGKAGADRLGEWGIFPASWSCRMVCLLRLL